MAIDHRELIRRHQSALETAASEKTKLWWEKYMKGVIPFRGVGIPKNRELLVEWRKGNGIDKWSLEDQLDLALAFFNEPIAEDKLAGILFLQNFLYDKLPWKVLLGRYEEIYTNELIFDWNICDWFCVRVLGATVKKTASGVQKLWHPGKTRSTCGKLVLRSFRLLIWPQTRSITDTFGKRALFLSNEKNVFQRQP